MNRAINVYGGQDSNLFVLGFEKYDLVETIGFNYNQRHNIELEIRKQFLSF